MMPSMCGGAGGLPSGARSRRFACSSDLSPGQEAHFYHKLGVRAQQFQRYLAVKQQVYLSMFGKTNQQFQTRHIYRD